jgi:hypothetical protein
MDRVDELMAKGMSRAKAKIAAKHMVTMKPTKKGQKPIVFKAGGLHKSTGTPKGKKIPAKKMKAALSGKLGPKAEKQARFKKNVLTGRKKKR